MGLGISQSLLGYFIRNYRRGPECSDAEGWVDSAWFLTEFHISRIVSTLSRPVSHLFRHLYLVVNCQLHFWHEEMQIFSQASASLVGFTPAVMECGWCHNKILNWYFKSNKDCKYEDISHPWQRRAVLYINWALLPLETLSGWGNRLSSCLKCWYI